MSAPRVHLGFDNFGAIVRAEARDNTIVLTTTDGDRVVLYPEAYAALVQYVEQAKAMA